MLIFYLYFLLYLINLQLIQSALIYKSNSDVNIGFLVENCNSLNSATQTLIETGLWTAERLNSISYLDNISIGVSVYGACTNLDAYQSIFEMYSSHKDRFLLGIIIEKDMDQKIIDFANGLNLNILKLHVDFDSYIRIAIRLLDALNWKDDVFIVASGGSIIHDFYEQARSMWLCVKGSLLLSTNASTNANMPSNFESTKQSIVFGSKELIKTVIDIFQLNNKEDTKLIFVPLDGSDIKDLPYGSFIIQEPQSVLNDNFNKNKTFIPTPKLLEMAKLILDYTTSVKYFIAKNCNDTFYKISCLRKKHFITQDNHLSTQEIISELQIESLIAEFHYNVYRIENISVDTPKQNYLKTVGLQNYILSHTISLLTENLTNFLDIETNRSEGCLKTYDKCALECENFKPKGFYKILAIAQFFNFSFKTEPWVFALLSLAFLGIAFCLAIFCYIMRRLCKNRMLEGNPILTVILLLDTIIMYAGTISFAITSTPNSKKALYLVRSHLVTLPYTCGLGLILSRTILVANIYKEVGFMSHIGGIVQSFLAFFIFAVQCALNIQLIQNCEDLFKGFSYIYLMIYNILLLILLVIVTPMVSKSQRNYKEGKYFTITVMMMACSWSSWLPGYAMLSEEWRDSMLCIGLVSTASILLGCIFIPRTYHMTISAAKDRYTSVMASLNTSTSIVDVYRSPSQTIYDCVNVAAINAVNTRTRQASDSSYQYQIPHDHLQRYPISNNNNIASTMQIPSQIPRSEFYIAGPLPEDIYIDRNQEDEDDYETNSPHRTNESMDSTSPDRITKF